MWMEIHPTSQAGIKQWDIAPKPAEEFEVRIVIWDSKELKIMDIEGTTDGFVQCILHDEK